MMNCNAQNKTSKTPETSFGKYGHSSIFASFAYVALRRCPEHSHRAALYLSCQEIWSLGEAL